MSRRASVGINYLPGDRRGSHIENGFMDTGRRGSYVAEVIAQPDTLHIPDEVFRKVSVSNPDFGGLQADSKDATDFETTMSVREGLKLYKKGIGWSIILSTAIVMEGYDTILLGNFYGNAAFNRKFGNVHVGQKVSAGGFAVSASWRSGLSNGAQVGEILGLFACGIAQDRWGYRKTIAVAMAAIIGFLFLLFFAQSIGMLLAGEILCGISWGVFQTITTAYASEVTPVVIRPYLTTYVNLCWVMGQLIAAGVLNGMVSLGTSQWGWRIPYAIQWAWPIPILIGVLLCPESPWWLVRHGRYEEAKKSLLRLTSAGVNANFDPDKTIAMMEHTNEIEKEIAEGTSYFDCFKGIDLRRTEIVCITWLIQNICGSAFMGQSTTFFEAAGLNTTNSTDLTVGQFSLGAVGTMLSWFLMTYAGRRTIYLWGDVALFFILITIGCLATHQNETSFEWAIGALLLIFTFTYDLSIGPVCYSLVAELSSTRLKAKTIVLSRNLYNVGGIVVNILTGYMLAPTNWNWRAYSAFFWAGSNIFCVIWIFFRLPEPKNRTYGELDILFENKVNARKFASTNVDFFRGDTIAVLATDDAGQPIKDSLEQYKIQEAFPSEKVEGQQF